MKRMLFLLICFMPSLAAAQTGWNLVFSDEFNASSLDTSKWGTGFSWGPCGDDGGVTNCDFPANVSESGGQLHLIAEKQSGTEDGVTYPYTSGMINSYGKFLAVYGYFDVRLRMPPGNGFWGDFWLLPESNVGTSEIDAPEIHYNSPTTLREALWSDYCCMYNDPGVGNFYATRTGPNFFDGTFHVFGLDWEPGSLTYYVDGVLVARYISGTFPPPASKYLNVSLTVGSTFGDNVDKSTPFPSSMDIDYVRVYSQTSGGCYTSIPAVSDPIPAKDCPVPKAPSNLKVIAK